MVPIERIVTYAHVRAMSGPVVVENGESSGIFNRFRFC